jgi:RNA polymerase primary sigma factor
MRQLKITKQVTNRETASLDKYLQEIGKVDLITADEEVELAQRIKAGDQTALEKLTKANLRFVVSVAKQYQNQGLTLPDLINEGNLGLIKAAKRFDETRVLNLSLMLYGGFVSLYYKRLLNNLVSFVCH